jgi:hypothetical protein
MKIDFIDLHATFLITTYNILFCLLFYSISSISIMYNYFSHMIKDKYITYTNILTYIYKYINL